MTDSETLNATPEPDVPPWVVDVWHLWRSENGAGAHYATRRDALTDRQMSEGYERTIPADSLSELIGLLNAQPDAPETSGAA